MKPNWKSLISRFLAWCFALALLSQVPTVTPAFSNFIAPGKRIVKGCVRFTGLESFPEWKFLVLNHQSASMFKEVDASKCIQTMFWDGYYSMVLLAMPVEEFTGNLPVNYKATRAYPWTTIRVASESWQSSRQDENYLYVTNEVEVEETSPLVKVEEVIEVTDIYSLVIKLEKGMRRHVYSDGSTKVVSGKVIPKIAIFAVLIVAALSLVGMKLIKRLRVRRGGT